MLGFETLEAGAVPRTTVLVTCTDEGYLAGNNAKFGKRQEPEGLF